MAPSAMKGGEQSIKNQKRIVTHNQSPINSHKKPREGPGGSSLEKRVSSMQSTLTSLNRLIETIDRAKPEAARLDGEKKVLLQNFASEFQIKSLKEAKALLTKWNSEKTEKEKLIQARFKKLKKAYRW